MASAGINVLRWSALGLGVVYGIYHQSTIRSRDRQHVKHEATKAEYKEREQLITQAKAEYARNNNSGTSSSGSSNDLSPFPWLQESK